MQPLKNKLFIWIGSMQDAILKYLLIGASILLIVLLLPKEAKYKYEFQKGKPWMHESLIAPFDFAINKTPEELEEERKAVVQNSPPYFRMDTTLYREKLNRFFEEFEEKWTDDPETAKQFASKEEHRALGSAIIRDLYNRGIIMLSSAYENQPHDYDIFVIRNNVAEEKELGEIYTVQTAYADIKLRLQNRPKLDAKQLLPLLENAISHNIFFDEETTRQINRQLQDDIAISRGMVQKGELIISTGELINEEKFQELQSIKNEIEKRQGIGEGNYFILAGYLLIVSLAITMLIIFLAMFRKDIYANNQEIALLMLLMVLMTGLFTWAVKADFIHHYLVPVCILAIIIRGFFDTRLALFTHTVLVLILGMIAPNGFEFVFLQMIAGMVTIFSIKSMRNRSQLFVSSGYILFAYTLSFIGIAIIQEGGLADIKWMNLGWFMGNALLTLFAFPLIYVFEKMFGFISDVSLMELSDLNSPLLRELQLKAPGTFQHSLQVANLAEAAIYKIGGNSLLIRTGALYHDVGKMDMPQYFIENQNTQSNPHDELPFEESARIIISHVIKGIEKARKFGIPEIVIDFIRTHHGNTRVQYFYQSFLKNFPDQVPDDHAFRYAGPLPFSKETAVLMMADSVEAASRSLKNITQETIDKLVDSIIDNQIEQNQFNNSDITYRDISQVKKIFKKMLMSIYHVRVEYAS